jgi:hypothetical protein
MVGPVSWIPPGGSRANQGAVAGGQAAALNIVRGFYTYYVGDKGGGESEEAEDKNTPDRFKDHAWFIAFAPKDHPTIAAACIIEHGGHGGSASAPVIHDVFQRYFQLNPPPPEAKIAQVLDQ